MLRNYIEISVAIMYIFLLGIYLYKWFDFVVASVYQKSILSAIVSIFKRTDDIELAVDEMEFAYNTFCYKHKSIMKSYPNITNIIDEIHIMVNSNYKLNYLKNEDKKIIEDNYEYFMKIYKYFKEKYPYYYLEKHQQEILIQLGNNNNLEDTLLKEISSEFHRSNKEIIKNNRHTLISYIIGVLGLLFTLLGFVK